MKKLKPHIGLYLAAKPEAGGIFQYALSLLDALSAAEDFEVSCFVENEAWEQHVPKHFNFISCDSKKYKKAAGRLVQKVSFDLRNKWSAVFDDAAKKINNSNCDLVVFPSQDGLSYQIKKKSLTTIHDLMHRYESQFDEYKHGVYEQRERHYSAMCQHASGILVDSTLGKQQVEESYQVEADKVHVLKFVPPYYLNSAKEVDIKTKYNLPENFVFYPAQFWEHKNHENLVKAIHLLHQKGEDVHCVFIGSAKNNYKNVISLVEQLNLTEHISILGYIPLDEIVSFYRQAKAMVFVSLAGPTNIPPVEAMMLSCPAIVSDAYAMPEQVGDGALLVDAKKPEDIADKIKQILDPEVAGELVKKGQEQIEKWNQSAFNAQLKNIILKVLS